jgi:Lar family restriction alleviation protein
VTTEADYPPLRPCPFCGNTPIKIGSVLPLGSLSVWRIECHTDCGVWHVSAPSKAEAADKWNRRAKL